MRFDLQKAMFVLPNLFTTSSIFCGIYAIVRVSGMPTHHELYQACIAVFFGAFFDMIDGRVARLTRTQSEFGVQLDSLADLITFGVAPAIIAYRWALEPLQLLGVFIAFIYVACGAIRLARFNVLASHSKDLSPYFIGLPIPLAAGTLISLVMLHQRSVRAPLENNQGFILFFLCLALLMVSNIRYRNFKDLKKERQPLLILGATLTSLVLLGVVYRPTFAIVCFFFSYVLMGIVETLFLRFRSPNSLS